MAQQACGNLAVRRDMGGFLTFTLARLCDAEVGPGADCNVSVTWCGTLQGVGIGICRTGIRLRVFLDLRYNTLVTTRPRMKRKVWPLLKEKLVPPFEPLPFP